MFTETEGTSNVYEKEFHLPEETELEIRRTFSTPGQEFTLVLTANNMHNPEDSSRMVW